MIVQQTLSFTQTREKPQKNDAGRAIEIDDTGEGREKWPDDQDVRSQSLSQTESESATHKKTDQVTQSQMISEQIAMVLK